MPLHYRILARAILYLCDFRLFRTRVGEYGFWVVTNKKFPKVVKDEDTVYINKTAQKGQVKTAKLICEGEVGRVKCRWAIEVKK